MQIIEQEYLRYRKKYMSKIQQGTTRWVQRCTKRDMDDKKPTQMKKECI